MARKNAETTKVKTDAQRRGDTGRSSSQGRKAASGGSRNTNNRGQQKQGRERM